MSAVMQADERQGPEAQRIPEHGSVTNIEKTNSEVPDTGEAINERRDAQPAKKVWCPEGFYWVVNGAGEPVKLAPSKDFVKRLAADAVDRFNVGARRHGTADETKQLIETGGEELKAWLQTRKAINDMAYAKVLKQQCDDASYQLVQAAKYRADGMARMRNNLDRGFKGEDDTVKKLRTYGDNAIWEGYMLTRIVLAACADEAPPTFDYEAAAWRACNYSAGKLTDTILGNARNKLNEDRLDQQASNLEAQKYFD